MKRFIIVLAALLATSVVLAAPANAESRGKRFYDGLQNPSQLAELVQANLARDPSGDSMLDPSRCSAPHWSCAAPADYLKIIQKFDPGAAVDGQLLTSVAQLPDFLRKLQIEDAPPGKYWMACMRPSATAPSGWEPLDNCVARAFHQGEKAWVDPDTGKIVLAADCTNPVGRPEVKTGCVDDVVWAEAGETVLLDEHGPHSTADDACTGLKRAGETDFESPWIERCLHPYCSLRVADRFAKYPEQNAGSFYVDQTGYFIVRHPAYVADANSGYQYFYCRHRGRWSACVQGIQPQDYLRAKNPKAIGGDLLAAIIYPAIEELAQSATQIPRGIPVLEWDFDRSHCIGR